MKKNILSQTKNKREPAFDFLRGTVVFLMILAHTIFFFHDDTNIILRTIARTGNVICFTIFLFISGSGLSYGYLNRDSKKNRIYNKRFLKRILYILLGYYSIAFISKADTLTNSNGLELFRKTIEIIILKDVPNFTEFLLPFVIYSFSVIPFKRIYHKVSEDLKVTLLLSGLLYFFGYLLYPLSLNSPWGELKALFVGDVKFIRFPILQYSPVFLLGIYWGNFMKIHQSKAIREAYVFKKSIILTLIVLISSFLSNRYPLVLLEPLRRWPPSISFLSIGIVAALLLYVVYTNIKIKGVSLFWRVLNYLGRDAFDLFIVHILLLFFYKHFIDRKFTDPLIVVLLFLLLLISSIFISSLNWKVSPSIFTLGPIAFGKHGKYRPKKRHLLLSSFFVLTVLINLNYQKSATSIGSSIDPSEILGTTTEPLDSINDQDIDGQNFPWFDSNYGFFKQVTVKNNSSFTPIEKEKTVELTIDYKELTNAKKAKANGNDLVMVYFDTNNEYANVAFSVKDLQAENTKIQFKTMEKVYPNKFDNRYFLYYGSDIPQLKADLNEKIDAANNYIVTFSQEYSQSLTASINRKWHVKNAPYKMSVNPLVFSVKTRKNSLFKDVITSYEVTDTNIKGNLKEVSDGNHQIIIDTRTLKTGEYFVQAHFNNGVHNFESRKIQFFVSEPVYVAWTLDWEGWDVNQNYLTAIDEQANKHSVPITHFFNPRIYLPSVMTPDRAEYLTSWIKSRTQEYGDEVQLHLHMHYDMLKEIGIEPKKNPKWGNYDDGYDVLTTAYSYEEFDQIIDWATMEFASHGLQIPTGYRAGGWFADENTLQALEDNNFLYDSSGREKYMWSGRVQSPWNLSKTTQPYYPSKADQNISDQNNFDLLEIPNNGGDCWAYTEEQMKDRLSSNFDGKPLSEPKAITFLGHPQWYQSPESRDEKKIEEVFETADQFLYEKDKGPLFYVTLKDVYELWK